MLVSSNTLGSLSSVQHGSICPLAFDTWATLNNEFGTDSSKREVHDVMLNSGVVYDDKDH